MLGADAECACLVSADGGDFRQCFGRRAFALEHHLETDPLFSLPRLAQAASRCRHYAARRVKNTEASFNMSELVSGRAISDVLDSLQDSHAWIKLSSIDVSDPDYKDVVRRFLQGIQNLTDRPIVSEITWSQLTVFIASPHVVTSYHIDHEMNFLCQISGEKDVCLFDPSDRELLPDDEIERFYFGNWDAAAYRNDLQSRGRIFRLAPGVAVHQPPLAPHWVKNGPKVSISASVSFCMREIDRRAKIYQANYFLRRVGLRPRPPETSPFRDALKAGAVGLICTRKPKSYRQAVFSGVDRVKAPFRFARQVVAQARQWKRRVGGEAGQH